MTWQISEGLLTISCHLCVPATHSAARLQISAVRAASGRSIPDEWRRGKSSLLNTPAVYCSIVCYQSSPREREWQWRHDSSHKGHKGRTSKQTADPLWGKDPGSRIRGVGMCHILHRQCTYSIAYISHVCTVREILTLLGRNKNKEILHRDSRISDRGTEFRSVLVSQTALLSVSFLVTDSVGRSKQTRGTLLPFAIKQNKYIQCRRCECGIAKQYSTVESTVFRYVSPRVLSFLWVRHGSHKWEERWKCPKCDGDMLSSCCCVPVLLFYLTFHLFTFSLTTSSWSFAEWQKTF